jgi:hypothetical protein
MESIENVRNLGGGDRCSLHVDLWPKAQGRRKARPFGGSYRSGSSKRSPQPAELGIVAQGG